MDLSAIIEQIKLERKQIIYVGIGTAAGYREPDNSLALKNYHQYPPFLQSLKNSQADVSLSILLIDPCQEQPPYMVQDKGLVKAIADNNTVYTSQDQTLTLYTLRKDVFTDPYTNVNNNNINFINMTSHLRDLNNYAIMHNVLLIYHDFTGRNNRILAEYFDEEIKEHLDHIIYGLGLREDFGCYFDLTDLFSYHPFYRTEQGAFKLFNVYYYIVNDKLNIMQAKANEMLTINNNNNNNNTIINKHLEQLLILVKHELNNVCLQALRVVFRLITGEEIKDFDKHATEYKYFSLNKRNICLNFCREQNYGDLYDYLLTEFGKKLDIVSYIKGLEISGREMLEFITLGDDPFKWYDNVKHFL